jgi:hypothetical protein
MDNNNFLGGENEVSRCIVRSADQPRHSGGEGQSDWQGNSPESVILTRTSWQMCRRLHIPSFIFPAAKYVVNDQILREAFAERWMCEDGEITGSYRVIMIQ